MAIVNGQLTTCDRCGTQIFRRATGNGEADGGFTRWNNFESYPEGWRLVDIPIKNKKVHSGSIRVCPKCSALWDKILEEQYLTPANYYMAMNKEDTHESN